jgi:hypothetical protein
MSAYDVVKIVSLALDFTFSLCSLLFIAQALDRYTEPAAPEEQYAQPTQGSR